MFDERFIVIKSYFVIAVGRRKETVRDFCCYKVQLKRCG